MTARREKGASGKLCADAPCGQRRNGVADLAKLDSFAIRPSPQQLQEVAHRAWPDLQRTKPTVRKGPYGILSL